MAECLRVQVDGLEDWLKTGLEALDAGRWEETRERFESVLDERSSAAFERLAQALRASGDLGECFEARELAYRSIATSTSAA